MEQIVVKTEMQANGEILLFYVDGANEADAVNIENQILQMHDANDFEIHELDEGTATTQWAEIAAATQEEPAESQELDPSSKDKWSDEEVKKLLMFFIDNKETFVSGNTKKKHLWAVACKTMLIGKSPQSCEVKLRNLKRKYSMLLLSHHNGVAITWPLFELSHQAFHDDTYVQYMLREQTDQEEEQLAKVVIPKTEEGNGGAIVIKNGPFKKSPKDTTVEAMLQLYLQYKKNFQKDYWRTGLWETIAKELGEEDADYWHRRFLNFKQHYINMVAKRKAGGPDVAINWPYMSLFDQIFQDDPDFQKKYSARTEDANETQVEEILPCNDWNQTEMMILVKYCFDCFDEFQDSTIPDSFLWNEVGRLLDKKQDVCKQKYEELKNDHLDKYIQGGYDIRNRNPLAILFDNIIARETELELDADKSKKSEGWQVEEMDDLVQFLYANLDMLKDPVCYYVCWPSAASKLGKSIHSCKRQWEDLKELYKSILDDKKEDPDMQIDWRYIELFDRIFDYGMDTNLLNDFKEYKELTAKNTSQKIGVKKVNINIDVDPTDVLSDDEEFDERGFTKRTKRGVGDSKAFKILEYYQKHKDKFATTQRKKQVLWETLAQQIGISGEQCAHRFRNLKQVYTTYVQREINKPEMPILWPYYALCKKVFGYRAIRSKLKHSKIDSDDTAEWAAKEIKQIINYFASNFAEIASADDNDSNIWFPLAQAMGKSPVSVNHKFLELRRSYRKLKSMKQNNPEVKVSWKYYNLFDDVYARAGPEMDVEELDMESMEYEEVVEESEKADSQDEDDYQCIIVIPEGQELSDISNAQIIINNEENPQTQTEEVQETETKTVSTKWTKRTKKKLLILYLNYVRPRKGREINGTEMWQEISSKLPDKTPLSCRKMFAKLKANHIKLASEDDDNKKKSPYYILLQKIMNIKPKFAKKSQAGSKDGKVYKDVLLPTAKVQLALQYYLQHIEEFNSPKFEKKYLWTELASFVTEPVYKLFNKINYLKQYYNIETEEVNGVKTLFGELLKEIINKENLLKSAVETEPVTLTENEEVTWSDEETEQLLVWYLTNLEKFKNPKFVRKYLWLEASSILEKSPLACSKKMTEIRTQYKTMIKENKEELYTWRFYELCQKIYGTGKKNEVTSVGESL